MAGVGGTDRKLFGGIVTSVPGSLGPVAECV